MRKRGPCHPTWCSQGRDLAGEVPWTSPSVLTYSPGVSLAPYHAAMSRSASPTRATPLTAASGDLAFADTVVAVDLDDSIPPSSGIVVSDETGNAQRMVPVTYPPPHAIQDF